MAKKETVKYTDIINDIKGGNIKPIYLLHGEEPYFIDKISDYIEQNLVEEEAKDFDLKVHYGLDITIGEAIMEAKTYPMIGERNVVIIKEAQNLKSLDALANYAKNPNPQSVFVLCHKYKKIDARKSYATETAKTGVVFNSAKLYDNELPRFIDGITKEANRKIEPKAMELLSFYVGANLQSLENEIKKIANTIKEGETITYEMITKSVGVSREFNTFELLDAVRNKDVERANLIALKLGGEKIAVEPIVASFYNFFSKLCVYHKLFKIQNPNEYDVVNALGLTSTFFAKQYISGAQHYNVFQAIKAIEIIRTADERSKGMNVSPLITRSEIIQEMIYSLIHCRGIKDPF